MYRRFIKPLIDKVLALILAILTLPFWLFSAIGIFLRMGRPVLFTQSRIGYQNKVFKIYKFRTMSNQTDAHGNLLPDADRLTKIGDIIRSLSFDELPQIINVLKGDMSFIGPRPLLVEYLPLYSDEQKRRHDVSPGISGWAQVNGRNMTTWQERFKHDVYYVDHQSLYLDAKIFVMTILNILSRKGISSSSHATMENFKGN